MPVENFVTEELLQIKLQIVLQTWPLYRTLDYTGAQKTKAVPEHISLFCDNCVKETFWEAYIYAGEDNRCGFSQKEYKCRNCANRRVSYYFCWARQSDNRTLFFKVGQYPELEEQVSKTLEKALSPEDLKLYKNALKLRNFNLGIAAVAYMRRVVENRMNDMLEVLLEAARVHNAPAELLARHQEVMKEKRFAVKVDYAGDLLPANLRPAGKPNPMTILHELTSDGLHSKTDEECVDIFDACRQTFEYVFGKMRVETEDAKNFVKGMALLTGKRKAIEENPA